MDTPRNTFKVNMKLQKLLFNEEFCAFENGMLMESVRLEYKNNLANLLKYKRKKISYEDLEVLELTKDIYGSESADTLSNMSHQFEYRKKYLSLSNEENDYKNKSVVPNK